MANLVNGAGIANITLRIQVIESGALTVPDAGNVTWTVDLRSYDWNGFMCLRAVTSELTSGDGLDDVTISMKALARNIADDDWVVPENVTATATGTVSIATVGKAAYYDVARHFQDNGSSSEFLSSAGLAITFNQGAGGAGKVYAYLELR